jgi:hypothetical protein
MYGRITVVLALFIGALAPLTAQTTRDCGSQPGSVLSGVVRNGATKEPLRSRGVHVVTAGRWSCMTASDSLGRFVMGGLPAGEYTLGVGNLGYRRFSPVKVVLTGADSQKVDIELQPGGPLEDCKAMPSCASWVVPVDAPGLSEEELFELAAFRLAVVLTRKRPELPLTRYMCVASSGNVLQALRNEYARTVSVTDCSLDTSVQRREAAMRYNRTGEAAILLIVEGQTGGANSPIDARVLLRRQTPRSYSDTIREIQLGHYVGPLSSEGWTCVLRKTGGAWVPESCVMDWIS